MKNIDSETALREVILQLEARRTHEGQMLKEQFIATTESIRPINLLKSTFKEAIASRELKADIFNTAVGLGAGFLTKILFQGITRSPVRKLLGTALMFGITKIVAKHPRTVESLGKGIVKMIRRKPGRTDLPE
jgi:hypothetical protein